jgi:hypothetical protein
VDVNARGAVLIATRVFFNLIAGWYIGYCLSSDFVTLACRRQLFVCVPKVFFVRL